MIQAHNQISHFHALCSASGMDRIPSGRLSGKGFPLPRSLPKPSKSTATEAHFIEVSQSERTQFVRAWPQESKPKEILAECSAEHFMLFFPRFVSEVCFCFRLMLRLGDRVCTRACILVQFCMSVWRYWKGLWHAVYKISHFLNVSRRFFHAAFQCKLFLQSVSTGHLNVTWHPMPSYTLPVLYQWGNGHFFSNNPNEHRAGNLPTLTVYFW